MVGLKLTIAAANDADYTAYYAANTLSNIYYNFSQKILDLIKECK